MHQPGNSPAELAPLDIIPTPKNITSWHFGGDDYMIIAYDARFKCWILLN